MKKIVLLLLFCAAFTMANAQTLLNETFDTGTMPAGWTAIDSDGDGFNWDPASNLAGRDGGLCICSASYDLAGGVGLSPDNWLISPAITLPADATLTFYVRGQDPTYCQEHFSVYVSTTGTAIFDFGTALMTDVTGSQWTEKTVNLSAYTGQTVHIAFRHYNTYGQYWMKPDDITVFAMPTEPTIDVQPGTLEFANVAIPGLGTKTVEVHGLSLQENTFVTATTAAPFYVSFDGNNFSTAVTMTAANGTVYVRYIPTVAGDDSGTVNFTCEGAATVAMPVTGHGRDCSNAAATFEYFATADMTNYVAPERYEVYAIVDGQPYNEGTLVVAPQECDNTDWLTQFVDLSAFAGRSVQVGIHVISDPNAFVFGIQNFAIANDLVDVAAYELQAAVYPNPASGRMQVRVSAPMTRVSVYNVAEQQVASFSAEVCRRKSMFPTSPMVCI